MWTCPQCKRVFSKERQPHSCAHVPLEKHFAHKELAKNIFDVLVQRVTHDIGTCKIISLPCCVHLFGTYDFLAALPKQDGIELRFTLNRKLRHSCITQHVPLSLTMVKHCLFVQSEKEIDKKLLGWLSESYHLKDKKVSQ